MSQVTAVLLVLAFLIVVGGVVYILRPAPDLELTTTPIPTAVPTPIDNTMQLGATPTPLSVTPINQVVQVTLKTSQGDIALTLDGTAAPITVGNFVFLAQQNFYDGTTFHRVIPDFMIQGGDPLSKNQAQRAQHGRGGPGYTFKDEINQHKNVRGAISMANAGPNTNGSQFFIVTGPAFPDLDSKHTVFGQVASGMEIVDAISQVERDPNDNPLTPVVITDVVVGSIATPAPDALKPL